MDCSVGLKEDGRIVGRRGVIDVKALCSRVRAIWRSSDAVILPLGEPLKGGFLIRLRCYGSG